MPKKGNKEDDYQQFIVLQLSLYSENNDTHYNHKAKLKQLKSIVQIKRLS